MAVSGPITPADTNPEGVGRSPLGRGGGPSLGPNRQTGIGRRPNVIPDASLLPDDPTGQATPNRINQTVAQSSEVQIVAASADSVIPVIYGGPERTAGLIYTIRVHAGYLVVCLILCEGEIESITDPDLGDDTLVPYLAPVGNTQAYLHPDHMQADKAVYIATYLGTATQGIDPTLAAAIPGFDETMPGTAYIVARFPAGLTPGFPALTVLVKGKKVYDPRLETVIGGYRFINSGAPTKQTIFLPVGEHTLSMAGTGYLELSYGETTPAVTDAIGDAMATQAAPKTFTVTREGNVVVDPIYEVFEPNSVMLKENGEIMLKEDGTSSMLKEA